jgi:hypothetical protein
MAVPAELLAVYSAVPRPPPRPPGFTEPNPPGPRPEAPSVYFIHSVDGTVWDLDLDLVFAVTLADVIGGYVTSTPVEVALDLRTW